MRHYYVGDADTDKIVDRNLIAGRVAEGKLFYLRKPNNTIVVSVTFLKYCENRITGYHVLAKTNKLAFIICDYGLVFLFSIFLVII